MGSSLGLFNRQSSVHQIFGGGFVADVILWRQKNITNGILLVTLASWVVFEKSGYTILSLVSNVLLLLLVILFLWAKSAALLNRPAPPVPKLHLSEEVANDIAVFIRTHVNSFLSATEDVALGKDTKLFFKVALCLLLISLVGALTDIITLGYACILIILTIPFLYERYEDCIDKCANIFHRKAQQLYVKFNVVCVGRVRKWILEQQKLS